ncbi:DUF4082 domain-containing protein [Paludisphaera borealis]|uniref:PL9 family polysaccharide lyase n=1 Tax=Paludisphaera borealis TaxID=1387353 RepID=A0A1U7CLV6_9BACT|nr:DUF4082 domain-containing protein [Paludisphaera borealis]APW59888.1 PL9 family polysaccharide lyase [Paludisphaera borealis]
MLSNFFVSPTGSDTGAGTAAAPWKTLQHAADTVQAGDVVDVKAGSYAGFIMGWNGPQSGTAAAPITFKAEPGATINARNSKTPDAIDLENVSYITITGFTIAPAPSEGNWRTGVRAAGGGTGVVISNNTIQLRSIDQCGVMTSFTTDLLVQGNTTSGGWDTGIYVANSAVRPVVVGNTISNVLGNGILLNGDVSNGGVGVIPNAVVQNNVIHDVGMGGSLAKYGAGSAIDLGGVQNSVISNNLIYNAHAKGITLAQLQASQSSTNNLVINNTVMVAADGQGALRLADASTGNTILNNVLYSANVNGTLTGSAASLTGLTMDYNAVSSNFSVNDGDSFLSLAAWQSQYKQDVHSFLLDPAKAFVNTTLNDYHPSATSPLIDVGTSQKAPTTDLDGKPRPSGKGVDIGAYELQSGPDTTPPTVSSTTPAANAINVGLSTSVTATFSEAVQSGTISFVLRDAANNIVPTTLTYDAGSKTATLKPTSPLAQTTTYTVTISGVKDTAGNTMVGTSTWSFTTDVPSSTTSSALWDTSVQPTVASDPDTSAVELGVKFSSNAAGSITGIRFYKGSGNTGTHVGHLWSSTGQLLATATFTGETASGWQQVNFSTPVAIAANTVYVVSYLAPGGRYAADGGYFASAYTSGPLSVPANGGVYKYGSAGGFPSQSWNATNYWVTPVFSTGTTTAPPVVDTTPPTVSSTTPAANATGVATSTSVTATFSEAVQSGTISFVLRDAAKNIVPTTLTYDAGSKTATLKPTSLLASSAVYTVTVSGVKDTAGNTMVGSSTWSFTTVAAPATSSALWSTSTQPTVASDPDTSAVELGVKFSSNAAGSITGIRFYKGSGNTGTHVGHLWSSTGQLLATATFTGETASGWQQVNFSTPVAIAANTVYVVSYLAPGGRYAADGGYFASAYTSGPLSVPANGGVYKYGSAGGFPTQTWNASNYWVTPVFAAKTSSNATASTTPAVATSAIAPLNVIATSATVLSSSTTPTSVTTPSPAGVDQVFADDGGLDFSRIGGIRRKNKWA